MTRSIEDHSQLCNNVVLSHLVAPLELKVANILYEMDCYTDGVNLLKMMYVWGNKNDQLNYK